MYWDFSNLWIIIFVLYLKTSVGPMIDPRSTPHETLPNLEILLQSGCNDNEKCQCELSAAFHNTSEESYSIVVGYSQMTLVLKYIIKNQGNEPGYRAKMVFSVRGGVELPKPIEYDACFNTTPASGLVKMNTLNFKQF